MWSTSLTAEQRAERLLADREVVRGMIGVDISDEEFDRAPDVLPRPEFTGMSILLTGDESAYPPGVVTVGIDSPGMLGFY
ncbi:hypothetical protein [Streptomyces sp. NBC_01483]|uniref:hypothetical protein n=1 Tax=Streptomyces sp. NBC_01483 TaxID=2903883 RepID=UPI002E377B86|nr:hypothetical protein [Streptomyces sp. NBC_01483]